MHNILQNQRSWRLVSLLPGSLGTSVSERLVARCLPQTLALGTSLQLQSHSVHAHLTTEDSVRGSAFSPRLYRGVPRGDRRFLGQGMGSCAVDTEHQTSLTQALRRSPDVV